MNTVSVRVHYRPMRLGLCVAEGALDDLRRAVKLTSTLWGGAVETLVQETTHVPWSEMRRQMFIEESNGPTPVFLDIYHPLQAIAEERKSKAQTGYDGGDILPKLRSRFTPGGSPIDDVLLCTMGDYLPKDQVPIDHGALADRLVGGDSLPANGVPTDYWQKLSPLGVTRPRYAWALDVWLHSSLPRRQWPDGSLPDERHAGLGRLSLDDD